MGNGKSIIITLAAIALILCLSGFINVHYPVVLTEADNGRSITVSRDTIIEIRLQERAESGLLWGITASNGLILDGDRAFPNFPKSIINIRGMVQNPIGIHRFALRPAAPGTEKVECSLASSRMPPIARFAVTVNVV